MPNSGDDDYNRALDLLEGGKLTEAIEAVESALMSDSKDCGYWQLYAVLLTQAGRTDDAQKATAKASEFGLGDANALLIKAAEAATAKNWNKAVTACEQAIELEPERGEIWATYAANLMEGGYQKDALQASARAVELLPEEPQVWYLSGRILRLGDKLAEAGHAFQKAIELDPGFALAWYEKGMVHHKEGQLAEAKQSFLKAKELELNDPGVEEALRIVADAEG